MVITSQLKMFRDTNFETIVSQESLVTTIANIEARGYCDLTKVIGVVQSYTLSSGDDGKADSLWRDISVTWIVLDAYKPLQRYLEKRQLKPYKVLGDVLGFYL